MLIEFLQSTPSTKIALVSITVAFLFSIPIANSCLSSNTQGHLIQLIISSFLIHFLHLMLIVHHTLLDFPYYITHCHHCWFFFFLLTSYCWMINTWSLPSILAPLSTLSSLQIRSKCAWCLNLYLQLRPLPKPQIQIFNFSFDFSTCLSNRQPDSLWPE